MKNTNYPETFILTDKSTKIPGEIKHYGPAYVGFANEFAHFLDYTGQGYGFIYDGDWCKDRSYTIADVLSGHAMEPAPLLFQENVDYLWNVSGFQSCKTYFADPSKDNYMSEPDMRETLRHALYTLKQPVIIPQENQWWGSIVIGYKNGGSVLVVYYFLPHFMEMNNNAQPKTLEVTDWYNTKTSLFIAGQREKMPPLSDMYRMGIKRIQTCLEKNIRGEKEHYYDEWEAFLLLSMEEMIAHVKRTHNVPGGEHGSFDAESGDEDVWKFIGGAHDSTWANMAERRFYIMNFFRQAREYFPEAKDDLQALDTHFLYANKIMGEEYGRILGDPVNIEIFKNPEVRSRMADCIRRFKKADAKGLEMVETLLRRFEI
ncbi:MAG: hypothetical protein LBH44_11160 [Treponema sp.]|jgi:hypothetical protein|nr:hypothetical protein [Treponema sp.]